MIGEVHCAPHDVLAERVRDELGGVDAVIVDAPYSARTHVASRLAQTLDGVRRRPIDYECWTADDVSRFVAAWSPITRGWIVTITDSVLAPAWERALADTGRRAFHPLPLVEMHSRVRLAGDGPSSWACWIVVARPRSMRGWGTLPGAYVVAREAKDVVGGKPLSAMRALVRDYTRRGDVVCDPCCGAGTTLVAAHERGRRWIGGDSDASRAEIARARLDAIARQQVLFEEASCT